MPGYVPTTAVPVGGPLLVALGSCAHIEQAAFSDTVNLGVPAKALYFGASGNISLLLADGSNVTGYPVVAGSVLPAAVTRVKATSTTVAVGSVLALS